MERDDGKRNQEAERKKQYNLWLMNIAGVGSGEKRKLLQKFGSAEKLYEASEKELERFLAPKKIGNICKAKENWNVQEEYKRLIRKKIEFTCYGEEDYPKRLSAIPDPPFGLYYQGCLPDDNRPAAAIIGARACSEYGSYAAKEFGSKLAAAGIQIISGLAIGIDSISQAAALMAGGMSYGVLGCGVDICYPKCNRSIYERLKRQGGILSEYPPGTQPLAKLFPPRNRIISGLSDIVLVVEAKEKSGTLITVDMALEQGREVFAVPGRITDALSDGCHRLLRQGAGIAASPDDILEAFYGVGQASGTCRKDGTQMDSFSGDVSSQEKKAMLSQEREKIDFLTEREKLVYTHLDTFSKTPEAVFREINGALAIQEIMGILVELCMKGAAEQGQNGGYRQKNSCILKNFSV